ncbi:hypothetical protein H4Q26_004071 [Puccinia striiformis f. sp. tritici PST-130]|nr:hypothetical protein H4Q26_004071 [Puccinia striiformis f. sp. tritici PST-130]
MKRLQQSSLVCPCTARTNITRRIHPTHQLGACLGRRAAYSVQNHPNESLPDNEDSPIVRNPVGVQLLPRFIHRQIFPQDTFPPPSARAIQLSKEHLSRHGLAEGISDPIKAPLFDLPPLQGKTIDEHFLPGWTVYHPDGSFEAVEHPPEHEKLWSWTLKRFREHPGKTDQPDQLIPMPSETHRLIVGHHVGFDRARIQQEYSLRGTCTRFLDTMSLHIATFGLSNPQRPAYLFSRKKALSQQQNLEEHDQRESRNPSDHSSNVPGLCTELSGLDTPSQTSWTDVASMNSLEEVAKLHCGIKLDKTLRNIFIESDKNHIVRHIPQLLEYCARDVSATHSVYGKLLPLFLEQCPHPVSFAGMLHMGNPFLPVDQSWQTYLERSESAFLTKSTTVKASLLRLAEATRKLMVVKDPQTGRPIYEDDPLAQAT